MTDNRATREDTNRPSRPGTTVEVPVLGVEDGKTRRKSDQLATEEPMEIRVIALEGRKRATHSVSVTMRTPGNDFELAAGFLFTEGVIRDPGSIQSISYCTDPAEQQNYNIVNVNLDAGSTYDPERLSRHFYTNSSCGVCGKTSLELLKVLRPSKPVGTFRLGSEFLGALSEKLSREQAIFAKTGGLHASALFDSEGRLLLLREDVGRHNALDKIAGALLLRNNLPAANTVLMVSGRASFELVQKALMAGIPVLAAVGAPSSLAVELAKEYGMTLVGFLRGNRFNVYSGDSRVETEMPIRP